MKTNRAILVEELQRLQKQEDNLRKKIDDIDYKKKLAAVMKYEGKYFMEEEGEGAHKHISCMFVYAIDSTSCELKSIAIRYWEDKDNYFGIEFSALFNPEKYRDEKWIEISKEEFEKHYQEVQKTIIRALTTKKTKKLK